MVSWSLKGLCHVRYNLLEDRAEVGRAVEGDILKPFTIETQDVLCPIDIGVFNIPCQREAVIRVFVAHVVRDSSEAVDWEVSI